MKRYIFSTIILGACVFTGAAQERIVPSGPLEFDDRTYFFYPNGVLDFGVNAPAFYLESNDNGRFPGALDKVAVLHGSYPGINEVCILDDYVVPPFIEAEGEFYPVCAIDGAFALSKSEEIAIPDNISVIGDRSFNGAKVRTLTLPAALKEIGEDAFSAMSEIKMVYFRSPVPPTVTARDKNGHIHRLTAFDGPEQWDSYKDVLFAGATPTIYVPKGCAWTYRQHPCFAKKRIVEYTPEYYRPAFTDAPAGVYGYIGNLELIHLSRSHEINVYYPTELKGEGYEMGLSTEENPYTVTVIGDHILAGNEMLSMLTLPLKLKMVCDDAFSTCGCTSIAIPASVSYIGQRAFASMTNLKRVAVATPEDGSPILAAPNAFEGSQENAVLYIDLDTKSVDLTAAPWNAFKEIRDITELPPR